MTRDWLDRLSPRQRVLLTLAVIAAFFALVYALPLSAQEKPGAPAAKVEAAKPEPVLSVEKSQAIQIGLKDVQIFTMQLEKAKADLQALLQTLAVPGYQIVQGPDGRLAYAPVPKPEAELKKEPEKK